MGAVAVDMQPRCQQNPVFDRYRAVRKWCNEELIPTWGRDGERDRGKAWGEKLQANPSTEVHTAFKRNETDNKGGISMNQLSCVVKACSFLRHSHQVITKTFESCFLRDKRVKGMICACHHNKDNRLDAPKQRLDTESAEDTSRCLLSDRAPLTVLPGNTCVFSPDLSWVWEELGCFYLWYGRTKVVIYRKPESWDETSSPE